MRSRWRCLPGHRWRWRGGSGSRCRRGSPWQEIRGRWAFAHIDRAPSRRRGRDRRGHRRAGVLRHPAVERGTARFASRSGDLHQPALAALCSMHLRCLRLNVHPKGGCTCRALIIPCPCARVGPEAWPKVSVPLLGRYGLLAYPGAFVGIRAMRRHIGGGAWGVLLRQGPVPTRRRLGIFFPCGSMVFMCRIPVASPFYDLTQGTRERAEYKRSLSEVEP